MTLLITPQYLAEHFADFGLARTPCVNDSKLYYWDVSQIAEATLREFLDCLREDQQAFKLVKIK